jgi:hypothetical protein
MHEYIINVLTSNVIHKISFLQVHFDLVEVSIGSKCVLYRERIMYLANIQETLPFRLRCIQRLIQRIMKEFKFKIRGKTRVLSLVS